MFGTFQQSTLHLPLNATDRQIRAVLLEPAHLRRWLLPQWVAGELPPELTPQLSFTTWIGPVPVDHFVEAVTPYSLRLLLSRAIDGVHEWTWGEGWVQSSLEGVSLLPLHLGNGAALLRLKTYLALPETLRFL